MEWKQWTVSGRTPTSPEVAREMMRIAEVGTGDVVYELGCGEGNIVIAAAEAGARAVGVDNCSEALSAAMTNAATAGVSDHVKFMEADLHSIEFSDATVVALYLLPLYNEQLRPKLLRLRPGTRVVSHSFDMGDWPPDKMVKFNGRTLYYWVVPAKTDPPSPTILTKTLEYLSEGTDAKARIIRDLRLADNFTIVVLDDGSIGLGRNDFHLGEFQWARVRHGLLRQIPEDPLLLLATGDWAPAGGVAGSIRTAVANALSVRAFGANDEKCFNYSVHFPHRFFDGANIVVVVGIGEHLDYLVNRTTATCVHICDLQHASGRATLEQRLNQIRRRGNVELSMSDDRDVLQRIRQADLVVINDIALSNGMLDGVLPACARCKRVVLEGPGAAIHPKFLFQSGVQLILTTRIDSELAAAASEDFGPASLAGFQQVTSGIYRWPKDLQ